MFVTYVVFSLVTPSSTVMALTHGINGHFPCPVCLVPNTKQSDLDKTHPLCTAEGSKALVEESLALNASNQENLLKTQSLCPVMIMSFPVSLSLYQLFYSRMLSGMSAFLTLIEQSHLIRCIPMTMSLVESTSGHKPKDL
jgi:hypothetical protein